MTPCRETRWVEGSGLLRRWRSAARAGSACITVPGAGQHGRSRTRVDGLAMCPRDFVQGSARSAVLFLSWVVRAHPSLARHSVSKAGRVQRQPQLICA
ncbi:unnamed protein product [Amoebophrya sp. A25]|nr:unnamed protein product [Amoebophrya sp. A25]|eukprot:GSA25T00011230001.1